MLITNSGPPTYDEIMAKLKRHRRLARKKLMELQSEPIDIDEIKHDDRIFSGDRSGWLHHIELDGTIVIFWDDCDLEIIKLERFQRSIDQCGFQAWTVFSR